ncbi:YidE/YbjL duplication [Treponema sp.]|uniref:aspartate-alanine antiporter-like transporter n=1 Tax=Treponema sp. TaxID=166 RepID=UPI0025DA7634|nr:YidE/YbjL duplication [Treponema sp.]MCR5218069.1 YidE/YbjL duplication [Treponema sp.]
MTAYLFEVCHAALGFIFIVFAIGTLGYLVGGIKIKGIELGTAGVLLIALLYGVLVHFIPEINIGSYVIEEGKKVFSSGGSITLWSDKIKGNFGIVSKIGTALFVTAVGLIAGPKFFRSFNRSTLSYILLGVIIIAIGAGTAVAFTLLDKDMSSSMAVGLLTGGLTSTPGFSAGKEVIGVIEEDVTAGYGIAYLYGVLGVVLFVQVVPKILKVNMQEEVANFQAANQIQIPQPKKALTAIDPFGFFAFFLAVALGCLIGAIKIPVINFSLGNSGGCLIGGLIVGHFARLGGIDCRIKKETLNFMRELGLVLFLIGAGVPGGVNFISKFKWIYFVYGAVMTTVPMVVGYIIARYVFKLSILNNLGSITGGMTSTPALGTLIATAGTDEVSSAYAATYPFALVSIGTVVITAP